MLKKECLNNIIRFKDIIIQGQNFAYLFPCEQLKSLISNFTISFPDKSMISDNYTIMPHGSVTLVLFHNSSGIHSLLFGPTTTPHKVGSIANECYSIFIIEFQPAGFFPFTKRKQNELRDRILPFSLIDNFLDKEVKDIFTASLSVDELLLSLEKKLIENIQFQYPDELISAIDIMIQNQGIITSLNVSNQVFYASRHLNRLFNLYLGLSMKSFSRLVRINKAIKLLNERKNTLTTICEKLNFYDVSHFVKEFKIVCGMTPQEYRINMSDFYSEIAKF